jgi:hypothetical protein
MSKHRFREQIEELYGVHRKPEQRAVSGFVVWPVILTDGVMGNQSSIQQQVYQWAFQQALATVRPSRLECALADNWN